MREATLPIRQQAGPVAFLVRHRAALTIYALAAVLMAHVGAFHTGQQPALLRYAYFLSINLAGGVLGGFACDWLEARGAMPTRSPARWAVLVLGFTLIVTPLVWVMAAWWLEGSWQPSRMGALALQVAPVIAVLTLLQLLVQQRPVARSGMQSKRSTPVCRPNRPEPAKVLRDALGEAELLAIEAEDHYLRLHTGRGSRLVLMRLSDALEALEGVEGARTHRSWWVAKAAVVHAARGGGRAALTLTNGVTAPVSRTYAPELRRARWY